jgi:hypothetical protein
MSRVKKPPPDNSSFKWRAGETVYGDWRSRRAPEMRRGTHEERSAFADEIRRKTELFGDGQ